MHDVPDVVAACCVLHNNMCQTHRERFDDNWLEADTCYDDPYINLHT